MKKERLRLGSSEILPTQPDRRSDPGPDGFRPAYDIEESSRCDVPRFKKPNLACTERWGCDRIFLVDESSDIHLKG